MGVAGRDLVRVVLIDDDDLVRRWLRLIFESQDDVEVVGEAAHGVEGLATVSQTRPDLVVTDIRMDGMDGLETTRHLLAAHPELRVIVLTSFGDDEHLFAALQAGASGFLLKSATAEEIVAGVRLVASGGGLLSAALTRRLVSAFGSTAALAGPDPSSTTLPADVTAREREVLEAVSLGLSNHEIAERLHMSVPTAKTHVGRLLTKLAARDRAQLVIAAYESGLAVAGRGRPI